MKDKIKSILAERKKRPDDRHHQHDAQQPQEQWQALGLVAGLGDAAE